VKSCFDMAAWHHGVWTVVFIAGSLVALPAFRSRQRAAAERRQGRERTLAAHLRDAPADLRWPPPAFHSS
jgi:hypothetical protein